MGVQDKFGTTNGRRLKHLLQFLLMFFGFPECDIDKLTTFPRDALEQCGTLPIPVI